MRRQFPVVFVIAVATVFVALSAAKDTQSRYEGRASLLFVSAPAGYDQQGRPITVNPFNISGNGERVASSVVLAMSKSPAFEERLRSRGAFGDVKFRRRSDSILDLKTSAKTPAGALETLSTAVTVVSDQLASSQAAAGAPLGTYMKIETLASTDRAREIAGTPIKSVGAIAVVGIVVAVAAAAALDSVAPHGVRSSARWVTRGFRRLGGVLSLPPAGRGSPASRPNGGASPPAPPAPAPARPATAATPTTPATPMTSATPTTSATPATSGMRSTSATPSSTPSAPSAPSAPEPVAQEAGASASTPGAAGNRQMRRQAAREASRTRGREPTNRPSTGAEGASRSSRSV